MSRTRQRVRRQRTLLFRLLAFFSLFLLFFVSGSVAQVQATSANVVISQVYGGGGNTGAPFKNDFVELYNRGTSPVSLSGWSVQYASATGTGNFGGQPITALSGTLAPGQYYLVQQSGGTNGVALPTPDATGTVNISGTGGKVALLNTTTGLACNGGSTSCSPAQLAQIVDLVGWDGANFFEGAAAPATTNTTSISRLNGGCTETDNNAADFSAGAPNPRNTASPTFACPLTTNPSGAGAATPSITSAGGTSLLTVTVTPGTNPPSTGLGVTADLTSIGGAVSQVLYNDGTNGDVTAGDNVFSYFATVNAATTPGSKTLPFAVTDAQSRSGTGSIALTVTPPPVAIHTVQGATHISPLNGQPVTLRPAVVTALRRTGSTRGFYLQDPNPDANDATSEGIFVFTGGSSDPATLVTVGDRVVVSGTVSEFRPASSPTSLTLTELVAPFTVTKESSGNALPAPIVIGTGGRVPPAAVIEDDAGLTRDVETSGVFDPAQDGVDFYESLEGMLVQVNDAVVVGPRSDFGSNHEIPVVGDNGANASLMTPRGGIIIRPGDFNPERIILNDWISDPTPPTPPPPTPLPAANVGDKFPGQIVGVIDYSFGNFKLQVITRPPLVSGGLDQETTAAPTAYQLSVSTFNVENLAPSDAGSKYSTLAGMIVVNLKSPDLIAIEEIQDNNGVTDDGTVDASATWNKLIAEIQAPPLSGPNYQYRQINPVNDQDGGAPGGNIRQGFLFRTDRGLSFVDRPGAGSTTANAVTGTGANTALQFSPGRIDPTNAAFNTSRKPLAGEFLFKGSRVFVIANHFNSKGGDDPLFGHIQPPVFGSEVQRVQQATVVHNFVDSILAADPQANIVVLGDLNDFQFSNPMLTLTGTGPQLVLNDLITTLPESERYTYVFEGNSETLDHILIGNSTFARPFKYDVVHVNSEFANQASDHEPQVAQVCVDGTPPAISIKLSPDSLWPPNHKYVTVKATVNVPDNADPSPVLTLVSVTSNEPDNGLGDGDTPNDIVIVDKFTVQLRAERSGTGTGRIYTFTYKVADACGNVATATATVTVPLNQGQGKP